MGTTRFLVAAGIAASVMGSLAIVLYTWMNGRARSRGADAHWRVGWLIGAPGMLATCGGWVLLSLADSRAANGWLLALGLVCLGAGAAVYLVSARRVGRWSSRAAYRPGLQTTGIYAHLRHPQALSLCLIPLGGALASGSVPFLLTLPMWIGFWTAYTYLEEWNELVPAFGDGYRDYMRRTPRMLPGLRFERLDVAQLQRAARRLGLSVR